VGNLEVNQTAHKIQRFQTLIHGTKDQEDYLVQVQKWEGLELVGNVEVLNNELQRIISRQSLSLFKRLVQNKEANELPFLNFLSESSYKELSDWLAEL
jgi:hypothetical protein